MGLLNSNSHSHGPRGQKPANGSILMKLDQNVTFIPDGVPRFKFTSARPGRPKTADWVDFGEKGPKRHFLDPWGCWLPIHIPTARKSRNQRLAPFGRIWTKTSLSSSMGLLAWNLKSARPGRRETGDWVDFWRNSTKRDFQPRWACWLRIHISTAQMARNRRLAPF